MNVFFVDDSAVARKKIAETPRQARVCHKHALNGLEAWTRLEGMASHAQQRGMSLRDEVSLILVDAEMPEMDGYVLTRNIKADARFEGIPVVMHSSLSSEANRAMGKMSVWTPMWPSSTPTCWPKPCARYSCVPAGIDPEPRLNGDQQYVGPPK